MNVYILTEDEVPYTSHYATSERGLKALAAYLTKEAIPGCTILEVILNWVGSEVEVQFIDIKGVHDIITFTIEQPKNISVEATIV